MDVVLGDVQTISINTHLPISKVRLSATGDARTEGPTAQLEVPTAPQLEVPTCHPQNFSSYEVSYGRLYPMETSDSEWSDCRKECNQSCGPKRPRLLIDKVDNLAKEAWQELTRRVVEEVGIFFAALLQAALKGIEEQRRVTESYRILEEFVGQ